MPWRTARAASCLVGLAVGLAASAGGCTDVREFRGAWHGTQVGDAPELHVGVAAGAAATLTIADIDKHGLAGHLTIDGVADAAFTSIEAAEADALASLTFDGAPLRVYLAFAATTDGGGDALAVIALFDQRIEVRLLRGGPRPIYAILALSPGAGP
jgi:hypothetical protein